MPFEIDQSEHHYLAIEMNQQVWALLGQAERDEKANRRMEHFALASMYHWHQSGKFKPVNAQRGHWLLSRVYAVLGQGNDALDYARRCMGLTKELDLKGFDLAYAHEAMARSLAALGDKDDAMDFHSQALAAGEGIAAEADREYFASDLKAGPWFDLFV